MPYPYSDRSEEKLATCDDRLQRVFRSAAQFYDITILEGHRTTRRQRQLYMAGKSKLDGITHKSKHQSEPGAAVDAAPYPIDWQDTERFYQFGFFIVGLARSLGIHIRWGGDWDGDGDITDQQFNDLVHFEVVDD